MGVIGIFAPRGAISDWSGYRVKGADFPAYARLSGLAARRWSDISTELLDATGIDVGLQQTGGYDFCLTEDEWQAREWEMRQVALHTEGEFEYQMCDITELRRRIPEVSGEVLGASYSIAHGHVNPLYLLRALHQRMHDLSVDYASGQAVQSSRRDNDEYVVSTLKQDYHAAKLVFCAGLSNQRLCRNFGMHIPVQPLRGQLLITDRVPAFLPAATLQVRQTREGTLQIGDSHEDAGLDESTTLGVITRLACRANFPASRASSTQSRLGCAARDDAGWCANLSPVGRLSRRLRHLLPQWRYPGGAARARSRQLDLLWC